MFMSIGEMGTPRHLLILATTFLIIGFCKAGPVGNLPNVTSAELGLKEGSCAVGDVVYMEGDEFPGTSPCERCACARNSVHCARQRCEPQAGCKAVHRPDQCCPIYQCECEQEGRVYANGEKLVDPNDPCRVCYCQGGEMVCRRIACFVRDDCLPRVVPGRCCPEYDNCPLRAVTAIPGVAPTISSTSTEMTSTAAPQPPKQVIRQEITIKEITPVSEIPAITEVKVKEVLPSPAIEVADYISSKSPVIVREATSEKPTSTENTFTRDVPFKVSTQSVEDTGPSANSLTPSEIPDTKTSESIVDMSHADLPPSKISIPTKDTTDIETPTVFVSIPTLGVPVPPEVALVSSKAPMIEEEDPAIFDHNPAFPPIPDDLSVVGNHEDEIAQEQNVDGVLNTDQESPVTSSIVPPPETLNVEHPKVTAPTESQNPTTTVEVNSKESFDALNTVITSKIKTTAGPETNFKDNIEQVQENSMLKLRTAIPLEILSSPSLAQEEVTETRHEKLSSEVPTTIFDKYLTTENPVKLEKTAERKLETSTVSKEYPSSTIIITEASSTHLPTQATVVNTFSNLEKDLADTQTQLTQKPSETQLTQKSSDIAVIDSNVKTDHSIILNTDNPIDISSGSDQITTENKFNVEMTSSTTQNVFKETKILTTEEPAIELESAKVSLPTTSDTKILSTEEPIIELSSTKMSSLPTDSEVITVSRTIPSNTENQSFENIETTEFILTPLGSSESATDAVELIKISAEPEKSAAIIEPQRPKNMLTDFINLVGDVAAIGDHTETPEIKSRAVTSTTGIPESEELIPVNVGYKSKNNNANVNSITEVPFKNKIVNKQKIIEIVDEDPVGITDSLPPNDKVEPTTRRPIIDNVSDDNSRVNKTEKKDIEIITKSYVPTINRRPTKVVMKKSNEKPLSVGTTESSLTSASAEIITESTINVSSEVGFTGEPDTETAAPDLTESIPFSTSRASTPE